VKLSGGIYQKTAISFAYNSNNIEGSKLTHEQTSQIYETKSFIGGETSIAVDDAIFATNHFACFDYIIDNAQKPLTATFIKDLHKILMHGTSQSYQTWFRVGEWKTQPNTVGDFETTPPKDVDREINKLLKEYDSSKKTFEDIVVFHYKFERIHPFQDGNGRLSRLLTTLFLLQQGYEFMQYISFENHIENHKKMYYDALMTAQRKRITQEDIIDKWLLFFLESLKILTEKLDKKYDVFKQKGGYLNERQKTVKDFIIRQRTVKIADLSVAFPDISPNTLKKDLQYLKTEQIITTVGQGKGTVYVIKQQTE